MPTSTCLACAALDDGRLDQQSCLQQLKGRCLTASCNLDQMQVRPELTEADKLWLLYQLLEAVATMHACGVRHGDIKAENILLTSWNWLLIADLAPYKPVYVDLENPADFTYFFDTGGRRRCYLAPERFLASAAAVRNAFCSHLVSLLRRTCLYIMHR